ncbi:MAG: hypothetical protein AAF682_30965 [Planctomycetota bacterium]
MASQPRPTPTEQPTPEDLEAVGAALEAALPGLQVLDRGLEFDERSHAELAGVDGAGHLVLVRLAGEDADRSAVEALDLVAFARHHVGLIARHLGSGRIAPALEPRVLIVLEPGDTLLASRLEPLVGRGIELLELRSVRSAAGDRAYLVPLHVEQHPTADASPATVERFLAALPPDREEVGRLLCSRLARLDDELRLEATPESVAWFFQDQLLARLDAKGGLLRAAVGPRGRMREIAGAREADELLESALSRLVEEVGRAPDDLPVPVQPPDGMPLLTPEEIEAFRGVE